MGSFGITKQQRNMVIVLLAGAVLVVLNQTLLSPALPTIMAQMGVEATTVQWLTSGFALTEAVVIPLSAWFMGRVKTRPLFMGCMSLFALGSVASAAAPVFAVLLLGRILQAAAVGVMMVMVMSLILLTFPREKRGQAMGLVSLVISFAPAVGPSIGGVLVDLVGWRASFVLVAGVAVIIILLAAKLLVNREGFPRASFDVMSVLFSSFGLATLLYGISSITSSQNYLVNAALIVFGVVCVGLFARRQLKLDEPMLEIRVLKSRKYRTSIINMMLINAALIGTSVLMPLYLQNILGLTPTLSGIAMLPGALLGAFMSLVSGRIFDRHGVRGIALAGTTGVLLAGIGMCLYGMDSPLLFVVGVNVILGVSLQLLGTPVNTWGVNSLDNKLVQHATAVTNTMGQVGSSFGTAIIMSFTALGTSMATAGSAAERAFAGYHLSFMAAFALLVVSFCVVVFLVRERKGERAASAQIAQVAPVIPAGVHFETLEDAPETVAEVMDADPLSISCFASMGQAVSLLARTGASGLVVVNAANEVAGFISNGDVLKFFGDKTSVFSDSASGFTVFRMLDDESTLERIESLSQISVMEVATRRVVSVTSSTPFEEACAMLAEKRFKELPVIDDGKLVGIVRRRSLMRLVAVLLERKVAIGNGELAL